MSLMNNTQRLTSLILMAAFFTSIGCITYRTGELKKLASKVELSAERSTGKTISLNLVLSDQYSHFTPFERRSYGDWESGIMAELLASGIFSDVRIKDPTADIQMNVRVESRIVSSPNPFYFAFARAMVFLFPVIHRDAITINASFQDNKGQVTGAIERTDTFVTFRQLLLIFVAPFFSPGRTLKTLTRDATRSILDEALTKNII